MISKTDGTRIVREMAAYMRENGDHCTRETLLLRFSQEEVDTLSDRARTQAIDMSQRAA